MSSDDVHRIGMIEVLLDEALENAEQVVLDRGELAVPDNEEFPSQNQGSIKLGGGSQYLLTSFNTFTYIKGYTMCAYN